MKKNLFDLRGSSVCRRYFESFFRNFFRENYLKFVNELYFIFKFYFSILLNNFFKSVIWSLMFIQGIVSDLLKKWWCNYGQDSAQTSCVKHRRKKSRYLLLNGRGACVGFYLNFENLLNGGFFPKIDCFNAFFVIYEL